MAMPPEENIDDLFRDELAGHATPPDPALWNRLANTAGAERLDELFRARLEGHATPPARELWERLEDEHLRPPRKLRGAAWWPMALAAAVALLLVAGGAGLLWRGWLTERSAAGLDAHSRKSAPVVAPRPAAPENSMGTAPAHSALAVVNNALAATAPRVEIRAKRTASVPTKNIFSSRATATGGLASSRSSAAKRAATSSPVGARQVAERLVATGRSAPQVVPAFGRAQPNALPDAGALATAPTTLTPAPANAAQVIEVDVRRGRSTPPAVAVAAAPARPADWPAPRRLLGGLLRQAGHLARGERVSLAEATGLPETLTLQANLGGRTLTRSIQL